MCGHLFRAVHRGTACTFTTWTFLFIIKGTVQWYLMCGIAVDTTFFGGIACALSTLHRQSQEWTEDELISILDEMTSKYTQKKIVGWLTGLSLIHI